MNKKILFGTTAFGLMLGAVVGFQAIQSTSPAGAETDKSSIAQEVRGERVAVTTADTERLTASVRSFVKDGELGLKFRDSRYNPYLADPHGKAEGQIANFTDKDGMLYTVALDTGKVIQIGPAPREHREDPTPARDFTKRYTKEQLQEYAVSWLKDRDVNVDEVTKGLEFKVTAKDANGYFFRWYDPSKAESGGDMRFLQVGFTVGGSLLSYTNTL